ncbi:zinc-ribbon domain-containing protein [Amycolatopsis cynarae]|uniref:Zinc-ribbon domain-containing protein n=1 Tax=Amycolatopsis cynarae TaxID=2995223 RepID=A0ABY7AZ55_9PSEU|nr:zinc-ribbon domain-containing protein [Amycolatopsis sp. HUAS 11-8]WAL65226.1 zinc-ribbon domain-containing protein [Amycolatopsis sp. HUAS 11-8]
MIIYGYRRKVHDLTTATYLCTQCNNPTAHALRRAVTKFTLFFIPLFPIASRYFTVCTFCGATNKLTKAQAMQVQEMNAQQAVAPTPVAQQQMMAPQPQAGMPGVPGMQQQMPPAGYPQQQQPGGYPQQQPGPYGPQ